MKIFCDTSVIVAATIQEHEHHVPSLRLVESLSNKRKTSFLASHTLSECYATLTSSVFGMSPQMMEESFLKPISSLFNFVVLTHSDYIRAFKRTIKNSFVSGVIYDALILECALKRHVDVLYTWNVKHFLRFHEPEIKILSP